MSIKNALAFAFIRYLGQMFIIILYGVLQFIKYPME